MTRHSGYSALIQALAEGADRTYLRNSERRILRLLGAEIDSAANDPIAARDLLFEVPAVLLHYAMVTASPRLTCHEQLYEVTKRVFENALPEYRDSAYIRYIEGALDDPAGPIAVDTLGISGLSRLFEDNYFKMRTAPEPLPNTARTTVAEPIELTDTAPATLTAASPVRVGVLHDEDRPSAPASADCVDECGAEDNVAATEWTELAAVQGPADAVALIDFVHEAAEHLSQNHPRLMAHLPSGHDAARDAPTGALLEAVIEIVPGTIVERGHLFDETAIRTALETITDRDPWDLWEVHGHPLIAARLVAEVLFNEEPPYNRPLL